jgi:hypothetical protein
VEVQPAHVVSLRPDLTKVNHNNADFVIYNKLFNDPIKLPKHRIAYVVRVDGAPLVWVYQLEKN